MSLKEAKLDSVDATILQLLESENKVNEYLDENMDELVNTHIIPEIANVARAANLPDSFIRGLKFVKTGRNTGKVINTWGTRDKPLAKWFNYGTVDHFIQPTDPEGVLAWASGGPESGSPTAIFSKRAGSVKGETLFSKGHYVKGLPRTEAMEIGVSLGRKKLIAFVSQKGSEKFKKRS